MGYTKLEWQESSDENIRGYYAYDKYGVRHKVSIDKADELKLTMKPVVYDSHVMTISGYIKETIWYRGVNMNLVERFNSLNEELKRVELRKDGTTDVPSSNKFGLSKSTVIGWFSNKHNPAFGWSIHELGAQDKKEFGSDGVYRTLQDEKMTTNIAKFNFTKGTYSFLDNEAFKNGEVKFEKMSPYKKVIIDSDKIIKGLK